MASGRTQATWAEKAGERAIRTSIWHVASLCALRGTLQLLCLRLWQLSRHHILNETGVMALSSASTSVNMPVASFPATRCTHGYTRVEL